MQFNINSDAVVHHTNLLEKISKNALPNAIRGTLNKTVFEVKTSSMPKKSDKKFIKRQPNFFKANSRFENASGSNVNTMKATVGMVSTSLSGGNNYAVKDLEEQESGGTITHRNFVPLKTARIGNSENKPVRPNVRLSKINKIVNARNSRGKNQKEKFLKAVIEAGPDGFVLGGKNNILFQVKYKGKSSIKTKTSTFKFKLIPLYQFRRGRKVKVKATNFMKEASLETAKKMEAFFILEAERQVKKISG
ncbi:MAG TPA: hypothetical protein VN922_19615 [Bacteroidia bacterium]|nr:hypothetical protein [Bacteroidia bacterium]